MLSQQCYSERKGLNMISVLDIFKVGIGPSSSHTVGPMLAAKTFCDYLQREQKLTDVTHIYTDLYGSLGQTGIGHGTGKAIILGLLGYTPEDVPVDKIDSLLQTVATHQRLNINNQHDIDFPSQGAITYFRRKTLPKHANGMIFRAYSNDKILSEKTYYSIGGGFVVEDSEFEAQKLVKLSEQHKDVPYPFTTAAELLALCSDENMSVSTLMLKNESVFLDETTLRQHLIHIWHVMKSSIQNGISKKGVLPGGLRVNRRASSLYQKLRSESSTTKNSDVKVANDPMQILDWVNLFALAVNEENAAGGRVVTAPTNGAAGIIPAVMSYFDEFVKPLDDDTACRFLLTAAAIGILYKKNASISGAEVGCQGEVGVACSMAAGALTELVGGNIQQVENAAEIGMEHNLGLTCDPVGGLVQVPCIERNAMGAVKAINASRLAMRGDGHQKVSLDKVIKTMWDTGNDMKSKYKETARGGLAVNIIEC